MRIWVRVRACASKHAQELAAAMDAATPVFVPDGVWDMPLRSRRLIATEPPVIKKPHAADTCAAHDDYAPAPIENQFAFMHRPVAAAPTRTRTALAVHDTRDA